MDESHLHRYYQKSNQLMAAATHYFFMQYASQTHLPPMVNTKVYRTLPMHKSQFVENAFYGKCVAAYAAK